MRLAADGLGRARGQLLGDGEGSKAHEGENLDSLHFWYLGESFRVEVVMKAIEGWQVKRNECRHGQRNE